MKQIAKIVFEAPLLHSLSPYLHLLRYLQSKFSRMKKIVQWLLLFLPVAAVAQEKGVHFQHGITWQQVQAKAKAEKKYIFMDCYTTWCGPCKYMTAQIFPQEKVGDLMNANFINIQVQLDTTDNDNAEVKSWYATGHDIATKYNVMAYPTFPGV